MSKMLAEISRIVNEDVSNRISQYEVMCEAITNSIHANATKITCKLGSFDKPLQDDGKSLANPKVDTITVIDNGDGLNNNNYDSFCKYRTDLKKELGCKGVGRFIFLKVYENVNFKSSLCKENELRSFTFNFDFDTDNINIEKTKIKNNLTEISLSKLTAQYLNHEKHIDRRIDLDLNVIRERVLLNLIPTLFFYKKKKVNILIEFINENTKEPVLITDKDIPDFSENGFPIKNKDGIKYNFILHHKIEKTDGKLHAYYCANNRTVCEFSDKDFKITLPYGYSGFLLLISDYLNNHVNHERNDFDIFPIRTDLFSTVSWEMINTALKTKISEIVKDGIPETQRINKEKLEDINEERPYLVNYIEEEDIEMAGFIDKKHIIDKAKKKFDIAKEKVLANSGKEHYTDAELNEAIQITQNELVSYIFDRAQVISRLKTMLDNREKVEKLIHNLFMEKNSNDDFFCVGKNNLWLLDDRFTSYSYAASDKRIKDVLSELGEDANEIKNSKEKPDLSLFFSHNPTNSKSLKSVLIELKSFDYAKKPDKLKFQGIEQLKDYVEAFKNKENIEEIWAFLITDVDEKLANRLRGDDYTPLFSISSPIFHRFYEKLGISIYVIGVESLILDAEARNKVFLDIIKKQSKLNKILQTNKVLE